MIDKSGPIAAITGATGYVGSIATKGLAASGFRIRRLVRQPDFERDDRTYDIKSGCSPEDLRGVDVLVHCAYDLSETSPTAIWETNVYGTRALFESAVSAGVRRTILVSSMSAYHGTKQIYGRAKLASEIDAFKRDMCVIRPGLVYGRSPGGMVGALQKLTALPLIPLVTGKPRQFTVHEEDLQQAICVIAAAETVPRRPLGLAHIDPVPFAQLLSAISRLQGKDNPRYFPVPWRLLYWAIRASERVRLKLPIRADSLLGLVRPAPEVPNSNDALELGLSFRQFDV
jgi:nucleoside-diphosphate-sugar epimerase